MLHVQAVFISLSMTELNANKQFLWMRPERGIRYRICGLRGEKKTGPFRKWKIWTQVFQ